jgi:hypothetical protein
MFKRRRLKIFCLKVDQNRKKIHGIIFVVSEVTGVMRVQGYRGLTNSGPQVCFRS